VFLTCRYNPAERPSAEEALRDPFFFEEPLPASDRDMRAFLAAELQSRV
jgi:L-alanine-DL-glutamate epimerase-like enolase superfamily enzyme